MCCLCFLIFFFVEYSFPQVAMWDVIKPLATFESNVSKSPVTILVIEFDVAHTLSLLNFVIPGHSFRLVVCARGKGQLGQTGQPGTGPQR